MTHAMGMEKYPDATTDARVWSSLTVTLIGLLRQ